jgi:regulatory protein
MARGANPTLLQRAVAMLARRERSRLELAQALRRHIAEDADTAEIDAVLDRLEANGLLSDQRFAAALVNRRGPRFGMRRIRQELQHSGVSEDLQKSSIDRLKQTELERARNVWGRKFGIPAASAEERARQIRFLLGRGFQADVIIRIIKGVDGVDIG